jgi:hypothetical protein
MKYILELVRADTRCSCQGTIAGHDCTEETAGSETVVASGTLADLPGLLTQLGEAGAGETVVSYIRVLDPATGDYLPGLFGSASPIAEGGFYVT